ncbi:hypothetical protein PAXRUDRAFT_17953 [Paxillus rubicundulus Ve08.2h10]|uniref:Uncharacterized protein n=1 Tax=Paxillus rubicundulus Ve08.2h10 TaxID=930991 RepID=A0A0D0CNB4_9AGAM|nr:hypothetical protein PAXRUDRAFT_17953 [Paxillus rubicundulus Ve08.2h10]
MKLKYFIRQTTLLQAVLNLGQEESHSAGSNVNSRIARLHSSVLAIGLPKPYNMVTKLSQFVMQTMHMDHLRDGLSKGLNQLWIAYEGITGVDKLIENVAGVVDDMSDTSRGYCFLEE